jgi:cytochrome c-type biogenesis protein CcmH/NrfG
MAEPPGEVAVRDPDAVIDDIERTRENLAQTIDALTERVSPGNVARQTLAEVREKVSGPQIRMVGGAVALVTVAVVAYALWRRRR